MGRIKNLLKNNYPQSEDVQLRNFRTFKLNRTELNSESGGNYVKAKSATFQHENETHPNSALVLYLQTNLETTRENMLSELVEQVAHT